MKDIFCDYINFSSPKMPLALNDRTSVNLEMLKSITMKSSECYFWLLMLTKVLSKSVQKSLKVHLSEKVKPSMCIKNMIMLSSFSCLLKSCLEVSFYVCETQKCEYMLFSEIF